MTPVTEFPGPDVLLQKKKKFLFPCQYHFYSQPMQIVKGEGAYLYDSTGKRYLDCYSGVATVGLGHSHPDLTAAVKEQAETLVHTTSIYLTQPVIDLAEKLAYLAPGNLVRSFFCASGSESVETAILLAEVYTGRQKIIALNNSLHGRTKLGMSLTGLEMWRADPFPVNSVTHVSNPYCYRCPLRKTFPECGLACAGEIETTIKSLGSENIAAVILEPVQGNGGIIVPPQGYLQRVSRICREHEVLLILDEIQTGFGHTGCTFACEHEGVIPDILCLSKSLGNGDPISVTMTTDSIAERFTSPSASTNGGNPLCATAALMVLEVLQRDDLIRRVRTHDKVLRSGLNTLKEKHPVVGDVRGLGLMWGVELVMDNQEPATKQLDVILEKLKDNGFLLGKTGPGRNVLTLIPPLIISTEELQNLLDALDRVLP